MTGKPSWPAPAAASSMRLCAMPERADAKTDLGHRRLNFSRSSALSIASSLRADQFHAVLFQHAVTRKIERAVERGLAAHGGQQRVRAFLLDDLLDHLPGDRLDVGGVRHARVGHDGGRIRIHQHHAVALVAQRLAGLRAGIVELAGLADDDGAGADDQDAECMWSFWHGRARRNGACVPAAARAARAFCIRRTKRSNSGCTSCGPGLASGWPWKQKAGSGRWAPALQAAVEQRAHGWRAHWPAASPDRPRSRGSGW
jgi:hypothetical protein